MLLLKGALNGFINISDINTHLAEYEKQISNDDLLDPYATSMLDFMVRGLFTDLQFPYAQFPCIEVSGKCYIMRKALYIIIFTQCIRRSTVFSGVECCVSLREHGIHGLGSLLQWPCSQPQPIQIA